MDTASIQYFLSHHAHSITTAPGAITIVYHHVHSVLFYSKLGLLLVLLHLCPTPQPSSTMHTPLPSHPPSNSTFSCHIIPPIGLSLSLPSIASRPVISELSTPLTSFWIHFMQKFLHRQLEKISPFPSYNTHRNKQNNNTLKVKY